LSGPNDRSPAASRGGPAESVAQILPRAMREAGFGPIRRSGGLAELWTRAAGPQIAADTRPSTLRRGVLTVEVRSASLLAELTGFRTPELLARVLGEDPSGRIAGLRFRLGVF
jgi:hypothetical protein